MSIEKFMKAAIVEAKKASDRDEVPIGAVIVKDGKIIARAYNTRNKSKLATDHAEVRAIIKACKKLKDWRLNCCQLFVTLEPCLMCLGACYNARIDQVFFGAYDQNSGGAEKMLSDLGQTTLNHSLKITGGILEPQCREILTDYFQSKRK